MAEYVKRREFLEGLLAGVELDSETGYPIFESPTATLSTIGSHPFYFVSDPASISTLSIANELEASGGVVGPNVLHSVEAQATAIFKGSKCMAEGFEIEFGSCTEHVEGDSGYIMPADNLCGEEETLVASRFVDSDCVHNCGDYNNAIADELHPKDHSVAARSCCVTSEMVAVIVCKIDLGKETSVPEVNILTSAITQVVSRLVHGPEASGFNYYAVCAKDAAVADAGSTTEFVIDLAAASGRFLVTANDFTPSYVVAALAQQRLAAALMEIISIMLNLMNHFAT